MNKFTVEEIEKTLLRWYDRMDNHNPIEDYRDLLVEEGLYIDLPPAPSTNFEEFANWYKGNIYTFFDGKHTIRNIDIEISGNEAKAVVDMNWNVKTWTPPEPRSSALSLDIYAHIDLVADADTGEPRIKTYSTVDK